MIRSSVQNRVEIEVLGERGEVFEFLDGDLVAEVRQVQCEFHGVRAPHYLWD